MTTATPRPKRNDPCHCGSGKKYKQCCLDKDEAELRAAHAKAVAEAPEPAADAPVKTTVAPKKHQTQQPWKGATTRGFTPSVRTPRKVGGS